MLKFGFQIGNRYFFWDWPQEGMKRFAWAWKPIGSRWTVWRLGPLNYHRADSPSLIARSGADRLPDKKSMEDQIMLAAARAAIRNVLIPPAENS